LRAAGLNGLAAQSIDPVDGDLDPDGAPGNSLGETWNVVNASSDQIMEAFLLGSSTFDRNRSISLGNIYNTSFGEDSTLEFRYTQPSGVQVMGVVRFVADLTADFDDDGDVDAQDLSKWKLDVAAQGAGSDADGDGDSDGHDFIAWQRQLGQSNSGLGPAHPVPEPAGMMLMIASAGLPGLRKRAVRSVWCDASL
jgi:hypothetical protein